ncbi:YbjN domain-containing protein [Staphylococcus chromogenes]|nr:YbjN domain-containing protein [Staphylococcus chromogenes]
MTFDDSAARPDDPTIVTPNLNMVIDAARIHGVHFIEGADRLLMPWELHRQLLAFVTAPRAYLLSVAQLRCRLALADVDELVQFLSQWNAERINPTGMFTMTDEGELAVHFRSHLAIGAGISMQQLCEFFTKSAETSHMAMDEMQQFFGPKVYEINDIAIAYEDDHAMRSALVHRYDVDADPTERTIALQQDFLAEVLGASTSTELAPEDQARPVTIERVADAFAQLGIEKSDTESDFLITAINDIFLAAFIDNGPSLLIRGHWDANYDPATDTLRTFLAANDWNNASPTTRALWLEDEQGLQLRVEYAISVESGLSDAQLEENLIIAMHDILKAIDNLSIGLTGTSAVHWPD